MYMAQMEVLDYTFVTFLTNVNSIIIIINKNNQLYLRIHYMNGPNEFWMYIK